MKYQDFPFYEKIISSSCVMVSPCLLQRSPLLWLHNPLKSTYYRCVTLWSKHHRFFLNLQKMFGNDCLSIRQLFENLRKSSSKKSSLVCLYSKQNITWQLVDMTLSSGVHLIHIHARACNILNVMSFCGICVGLFCGQNFERTSMFCEINYCYA